MILPDVSGKQDPVSLVTGNLFHYRVQHGHFSPQFHNFIMNEADSPNFRKWVLDVTHP